MAPNAKLTCRFTPHSEARTCYARRRRSPQDFAAGGTWAQEFAGAGGAGDAWADQFAAGLDGGEWAEQVARDADAGAAAADGVEVDVGAAGEYVFAADNPFMQARRPCCRMRSLIRPECLSRRAWARQASARTGCGQPVCAGALSC